MQLTSESAVHSDMKTYEITDLLTNVNVIVLCDKDLSKKENRIFI